MYLEARPVLYGSHQFNCAFSVLGIEKLRAQIGLTNFGDIKGLTVGWSDMRRLPHSFQKNKVAKLYRNLETLTIQGYFLVDLNRPGNLLDLDLCELSNHCKSARKILCRLALLSVLAKRQRKMLNLLRNLGPGSASNGHCSEVLQPMLPNVSIHGKLPCGDIIRSRAPAEPGLQERILDLDRMKTWIDEILECKMDRSMKTLHDML
jgi:hypothetical protein